MLAICSAYQDIRFRKVKNWLVAGVCVLGLFFVDDVWMQMVQGLAALVFGFILFLFKWWGPGDAKLFAAYAFLVPRSVIEYPIIPSFYALDLLVNGLMFPFVYCVIQGMFSSSIEEKRLALRFSLDFKEKWASFSLLLLPIFYAVYMTSISWVGAIVILLFAVFFDVCISLVRARDGYLPFAPSLALGVVLMYILQSNIFMWSIRYVL